MPTSLLHDVGPLFAPQRLVIIGASERRADLIHMATRRGETAYLVNPRRDVVLGQKCYPDVTSLPEQPDVALIAVGHTMMEQAVRDAIAGSVRALVIPGAGAEAGVDGSTVTKLVARLAQENNVALLGTNCMGYAQPEGRSLWLGTLSASLQAGHVSVLSQSGSVADALLSIGPRIGFRTVISSGNESGLDAADFVNVFAEDDATRAIGLFLETVRRPDAFAEALRRCSAMNKPVVCLKVGRSQLAAQLALTHTGAMVGSAEGFAAFLESCGAIEVFDMSQFVETLEVLGLRRWPRGNRLAAVSESGGQAGMLADSCEVAGLEVPPLPAAAAATLEAEFPNFVHVQNPIDAWAIDSVDKVYPRCFEVLVASGAYDIIAAVVELTRHRSAADEAWCMEIVKALVEATKGSGVTPVVISTASADPHDSFVQVARANDVALLRGPSDAATALGAVARWRQRLTLDVQVPPAPAGIEESLHPGSMPELDSAQVLRHYGVRFSEIRRVSSAADAVRAANDVGYPVVVKVDGPAHKSVGGGVILGVKSDDEVAATTERLGGQVVIAHQIAPGREVICGMHRDPMFGRTISIGIGGALAEAIPRSSVKLVPINEEVAAMMVASLPGQPDISDAARADLEQVLLGLSNLSSHFAQIDGIDINPLVLGKEGAVAVDALIVVRRTPS
jgi:acyl-CoA synthetase (NDP forming)